jgi:hypothetical protein
MRKLVIATVVTLCLTAMAMTVQAGQQVSALSITAAKLVQCVSTVIEVEFTVQAFDAGSATVSNFDATLGFVPSTGSASSKSVTITSGAPNAAYIDSGTPGLTYVEVRVTADGITSNGVRIWCDGRIEFLGALAQAALRLNYQNGDLIDALYVSTGSDGKGAIAVYAIDSSSAGRVAGVFEYALFEPYLETPPAENTLLGQINYSSLYALTTGEFQIVINDPLEPKSYTTVFSAFPVSSVYYLIQP